MPNVYGFRKKGIEVPETHQDGCHCIGDCSFCDREQVPIARREPDGRLKCTVCAYPPEACSKCGGIRQVATRVDEQGNPAKSVGKPLCYECSAIPEPCAICKNIRPIVARLEGTRGEGPGVCKSCYPKVQPKERCVDCGKVRPIAKRLNGTRGKGPGICRACANERNKRMCRWCGKVRRITKNVRKKGEPRRVGLPCCQYCANTKRYLESPRF